MQYYFAHMLLHEVGSGAAQDLAGEGFLLLGASWVVKRCGLWGPLRPLRVPVKGSIGFLGFRV